MILNADRLSVRDFDRDFDEASVKPDSLCPLCKSPLVAKRGEMKIWHWAHQPKSMRRSSCPWEESAWHLRWKYGYLSFDRWQIEAPLMVNGNRYIIDAYQPLTRRVREFVHSLSPYYEQKHLALKSSGYDVMWIFHGDIFASLRMIRRRDGSIRNLLRPSAYQVCERLNGCVHYENSLWKLWKNNIWFRMESPTVEILLLRYKEAGK